MFILYAIPIGILAGFVLGGRLERLSALRFRWAPLAVAGLLVQLVLFGLPTGDALVSVGPAVYVGSTAAVLVALLANLRLPGMALVAAGAVSNLLAIVANGGAMPVRAETLAAAGLDPRDGFSNSVVSSRPALEPLTDVFAIPAGVPLANVFSIGDLLIAIGIVIAIASAMRRPLSGAPGQPASRA
jgi:hypothetical protein